MRHDRGESEVDRLRVAMFYCLDVSALIGIAAVAMVHRYVNDSSSRSLLGTHTKDQSDPVAMEL